MRNQITILLLFLSVFVFAQVTENKSWCNLNCEYTTEYKANAEIVELRMQDESIRDSIISDEMIKFPLRIGIVQKETNEISISEAIIRKAIKDLNHSFQKAGFLFYLEKIDLIKSDLSLEDLSRNAFNIYDEFSQANDLSDMISIYVLDHAEEFCKITNTGVSCGRTGGFSYILSDRTNNIVMSRFDLEDPKILAHEFGHFFGLYHTFEEHIFGRDTFDLESCQTSGDRICDTPPDPGNVFDIYVNYSTCQMIGLKDKNGNVYQPLIENFMSYYKPCYLKEYSFTPEQILRMQVASQLEIREKLSR